MQPVQGRIRHKRHPSRGAGPCHLFRSSLEPVAPRAEKVTGLWRLIAAMLVPRTAANQVPKSGQWGGVGSFPRKTNENLKTNAFVGQRLTTRFIERAVFGQICRHSDARRALPTTDGRTLILRRYTHSSPITKSCSNNQPHIACPIQG